MSVLSQLIQFKTKDFDTMIPIQNVYYDKLGRTSKQEIFYYGNLISTKYFSYADNQMIVRDESLKNRNRNELLYKVQFDSLGNPLKYIRYQVFLHERGLDGLDSVTYINTYNKKENLIRKKQHFDYRDADDGKYSELTFTYKYNEDGQNTSYTVSNTKKKIYSVEKEYINGLLYKRNASFHTYDDLKNDYDSSVYFYGKNLKLDVMKRIFDYSEPDEILIKFLYDKDHFLSEEYRIGYKEGNQIFYKWEFYD